MRLQDDRASQFRRCGMTYEFDNGAYLQANLTNEAEQYPAKREEAMNAKGMDRGD
jgi:hypothetical protein